MLLPLAGVLLTSLSCKISFKELESGLKSTLKSAKLTGKEEVIINFEVKEELVKYSTFYKEKRFEPRRGGGG